MNGLNWVKIYLERARNYLKDYISEIPSEELHNIHSTHKVSSGWFQHCWSLFEAAHKRGVTNDFYHKRLAYYIGNSGFRERFTIKEDLEFTDNLLKEFIEELSSKL